MGFRFVRWLLMMFIFTFSSSHSHRGLVVIDCDWFDDIEWVRMNGSCLLKNENENEWNLVWEWTNKLNFNSLLLSARERNAVFSNVLSKKNFQNFPPLCQLIKFPSHNTIFFEWHFREQKHLKRENGNEMEKYLLLANQQCSKMNLLRNEYCLQWDLECLIKSNQIKSNHTFQYPISHIQVNTILISLNLSEWRKI